MLVRLVSDGGKILTNFVQLKTPMSVQHKEDDNGKQDKQEKHDSARMEYFGLPRVVVVFGVCSLFMAVGPALMVLNKEILDSVMFLDRAWIQYCELNCSI